jgi:two-component system, OmpR family, KDP operon response regulator KdpE
MTKIHVLAVDDDDTLLKLLRWQLERSGSSYVIESADNGTDALQMVEKHQPDVVILDLSMPGGMDGFEVCRRIRQLSGDVGATWIIILSALARKYNEAKALEAGADVYMEKPFDLEILSGYIHTALRRMAHQQSPFQKELQFPGLRIDVTQRRVYLDQQEIHLTKTQYSVLELLALNAGKFVSSEMIISKVWGSRGETIPDTARLRTCIREIRRALKDDAENPRFIITKIGMGYQFCDPST